MREETEEQMVIAQPTAPVESTPEPEPGRRSMRWMRYFIAEDASLDSTHVVDLQRRACWIGVALILQALNELALLVLVYLPVVPLLTPWAGLISFCLIGGSCVALWMALRPAPFKSGGEAVITQKRPRRWQRVIVLLLLISSLAGAGEIVASTVLGFFMTPIYKNDGTSIDMNAAILLTEGRDPYVDSSILSVVRRFSILPIWTTPLRAGQFASSASYPTADQLSRVLAQDLKTGKAPEFESKVSYPALSFLSLLPFAWLKTNNALPLYLICYCLIVFTGWEKVRPEMRPWLILLSLANVSMLTSVLNGNADLLYILLILLAWLLRDRRWWSILCLGLALATKQPAWLFLPFYAILIWQHGGLKEAVGRLSMAGLIALAFNLPFILWNPHAWLAGVLAPVADPMYPSGVGVVALGLTPIFPLLPGVAYSALEAVAMLFCIAWYWRICKSRPEAAMLLAVLPLFFAWRSLPSYFYCAALPLFILQVARPKHVSQSDQSVPYTYQAKPHSSGYL
jgi:Glycosyltransferase family 87